MKIVSLLPSGTEVVCSLGAIDDIVGVSHECDYPPEVRSRPVLIRSTMKREELSSGDIDRGVKERGRMHVIDTELLDKLSPDVVITQDICNVCAAPHSEVIKAAAEAGIEPTIVSMNTHTFSDMFRSIGEIAAVINREKEGRELLSAMQNRVENIRKKALQAKKVRVACIEWLDPLYVAGAWMPEMVGIAGGHDVLGIAGEHSLLVRCDDIENAHPEKIIFMPCSFPIGRTLGELSNVTGNGGWKKLSGSVKGAYVMDGRLTSRPGPRLIDGLETIASILHPEIFGTELDGSVAVKIS